MAVERFEWMNFDVSFSLDFWTNNKRGRRANGRSDKPLALKPRLFLSKIRRFWPFKRWLFSPDMEELFRLWLSWLWTNFLFNLWILWVCIYDLPLLVLFERSHTKPIKQGWPRKGNHPAASGHRKSSAIGPLWGHLCWRNSIAGTKCRYNLLDGQYHYNKCWGFCKLFRIG